MDPRDNDGLSRPAAGLALEAAAAYLRCPVCSGRLHLGSSRLACGRGHAFDIARQGYVNLVGGRTGPGTGDTPDMVAARHRFLGRGHYRPLAEAVASLAVRHDQGLPGLVADLAGGTGYYLAAVLDALPGRHGVCLDLSAPALRRAARAHPRGAAIGTDVWRAVPLAAGSAALVLSVFGPRNAAETGRILAPGGTLIIVTPGAAHLRELRRPLGMIGIDRHKPERVSSAYRGYQSHGVTRMTYRLSADHADVIALASMGPSARHVSSQALADRACLLPSPVAVTADLRIAVFRRPLPAAGTPGDEAQLWDADTGGSVPVLAMRPPSFWAAGARPAARRTLLARLYNIWRPALLVTVFRFRPLDDSVQCGCRHADPARVAAGGLAGVQSDRHRQPG